ncbi:pirin family protein [Christiangramia sabulilitoris]|uniref:Pirin family protein n=1 Tax=Christiangramia sabulilitoris TaxID=2583991 RepID=A0A550I6S5_9FLAO|nr:pirin family protein [Christiangramia sabulilitoris]TRO66669.1 pirin family protein [Christiangramia sabulilitoris]
MEKVFHPASSRGTSNYGWLNANYSFSFANYFDPEKLQFGLLRVLNDDYVKSGMGFGTHPHKDMEIISIPLKGEIRHKDSLGHTAVIKAGEVQVMSAGTGVEHSELNSSNEELNMLQIWIFPEENGLEPRYDQRDFSDKMGQNGLVNVVSPRKDQVENSLFINQQAYLHLGELQDGREVDYKLKKKDHGVYIFLIEGEIEAADTTLKDRDAIGLWNTEKISFKTKKPSKVLLIEVPMN